MKYVAGVVVAAAFWLPATVFGWLVGASSAKTGVAFASVGTAIPLAVLVSTWLLARWRGWREFALAFAITAAVLVTFCGICNFSQIDHGQPPRIAG